MGTRAPARAAPSSWRRGPRRGGPRPRRRPERAERGQARAARGARPRLRGPPAARGRGWRRLRRRAPVRWRRARGRAWAVARSDCARAFRARERRGRGRRSGHAVGRRRGLLPRRPPSRRRGARAWRSRGRCRCPRRGAGAGARGGAARRRDPGALAQEPCVGLGVHVMRLWSLMRVCDAPVAPDACL